MKVAVISDIHGYSIALDRVLADIASEPDIDALVVAGDLVESGPDPVGVLERVRLATDLVVRGNTDRDLAAGIRISKPAKWTMEQLGKESLRWLAELPLEIRISPPGGRPLDDDLLVVHANPFDEDRQINPEYSEIEVRNLLQDTRAAVIAFGHIHIAYQRKVGSIKLIDVAAVGNPKDEDLRSKWGLITWNQDSRIWSTDLRYVDYPLEATVAQMERSGLPNWRKASKKLKRATYRIFC